MNALMEIYVISLAIFSVVGVDLVVLCTLIPNAHYIAYLEI